jgi:lipopolysaccharide transport system ATP-binding protein
MGRNGAGKTTLLKMLNGLIKPDRGRIELRGRVGALISLGAGFNPILTARENIYVNGSVLGFSRNEINRKFDAIVDFAEIEEFIDTPVQNYSSGMKVRLGFAVAAQMEPDVLLIDEVLAVGDAGFRVKCFNTIRSIASNSLIILVSHQMHQIARSSTCALLLSADRTHTLSRDVPKVIEKYYEQFKPIEPLLLDSDVARISSATVRSLTGEEISQFRFSSGVVVEIEGYMTKPCYDAELGVLFTDATSNAVLQANTKFSKIDMSCEVGRFLAISSFETLPLSPGNYYVTVALNDARTKKILARWKDFKRIQIVGEFIGFAPIVIDGRWDSSGAIRRTGHVP